MLNGRIIESMDVWFPVALILWHPGTSSGSSDGTASDHQCCSCGRAEVGVWAENGIMENVWLFFAVCCWSHCGDGWWERCPRLCLWLCRAALSHCCQGTTRCLSLPVLALALHSARAWLPSPLLDPSSCLCWRQFTSHNPSAGGEHPLSELTV